MFGTSQRDWAYQWTDDRRQERRARSRERWADRRTFLAQAGRCALLHTSNEGSPKGGESLRDTLKALRVDVSPNPKLIESDGLTRGRYRFLRRNRQTPPAMPSASIVNVAGSGT